MENMADTLERIAKLLALAEDSRTPEAERDAAMSAAQRIATDSAISLEVARQHQRDKTKRETPLQKSILFWGSSYAARGKRGRAHYVRLFLGIAAANDVECDIYHDSSGVVAYGFPSDIEVCELLFNSLAHQMVEAAEAYLRTGEYKKEITTYERRVSDGWYGYETETVERPVDGRTARQSFYQSFTDTVRRRLRQAKREAEEAVAQTAVTVTDDTGTEQSTSTALVLVGKREEVKAYRAATTRARGSWGGGGSSNYSRSASNAGREAGTNARLGAQRSLSGGPRQIGRG